MRMKFSYRIHNYELTNDVLFARMLDWIQLERGAIDEIALFFEESHAAYRTQERLDELSAVCKKRIAQLHEVGVKSVGINMLGTLGHVDEAWGWLPMPPFQAAVGPAGDVSTGGQLCQRDERTLEYIRRKYRAAVQADPDFIWVDDDIRVPYRSINYTCFCNRCVERFNQVAHTRYNRAALVQALENPANRELRQQWLRYNLDSYIQVVRTVREEVEKAPHKIRLGLMTVHIPQNTKLLCDMNALLDALGAEMIRPGGGFYSDANLLGLTDKLRNIAFQNAVMKDVPLSMYEQEDFPLNNRKSVRTHVLESTMALMMGCDGIMTNSLPPCEGHAPVYEVYAANRASFERIAARMRQTRLVGARPAFALDLDAHIQKGDWFRCARPFSGGEEGERLLGKESAFYDAGLLPFADPLYEDAWVTLLAGEIARALPDASIKRILSRGVLMDGDAAAVLCERGYGDLIGCTPGDRYDNGMVEYYTDHPLNAGVVGECRDTFMTYQNADLFMSLIPADGAKPLATFASITGVQAGISAVSFENRLGGHCVVMGYDAWRFPNMWHRERQLRRIFQWLWNGHAPMEEIRAPGVFHTLRESADHQKFMLMLTNLWEDQTGKLELVLSHPYPGQLYVYYGEGVFEPLADDAYRVADGQLQITLPSLETHRFVVLMNE